METPYIETLKRDISYYQSRINKIKADIDNLNALLESTTIMLEERNRMLIEEREYVERRKGK